MVKQVQTNNKYITIEFDSNSAWKYNFLMILIFAKPEVC